MKRKADLKDNRGFTLIELIVVIAIISILAVGTLLGTSILGLGNAKSAAGRIKSLSDYTRLENMTKKERYYLVIYQKENNYYLSINRGRDDQEVSIKTEKLDLRNGRIIFHYTDLSSCVISTESLESENTSERLDISYAKGTGGIMADSNGKLVEYIRVEIGNKSYNIHLVMATGRAYID